MRLLLLTIFAALAVCAPAQERIAFDAAPHHYWTAPLHDPFTRIRADLESGKIPLDRSGELPFLRSLLRALAIPESSQMLIFSATSLQQARINPANPRALYFNDELYLGYIPGGKIEIASVDPALGGIFTMFEIPRTADAPIRPDRSTKCMNCHVNEDTRYVPGLVIKSVIPGPNGGSLDAFRKAQNGHGVPFSERFGGWYVTGKHGITQHWGNATGRFNDGQLTRIPLDPATRFDSARYLAPGSDILPQLIHEHQVGFDDRAIEAAYRTRALLALSPTPPAAALDSLADGLTRYLLFADEAPLPAPGVEGDPAYRADFLRLRRPAPDGRSLRDFDLKTRLFRHRCSYMIYAPLFTGLPPVLKNRVYLRIARALDTTRPDPAYAYLPAEEKTAIRAILKATIRELPWR